MAMVNTPETRIYNASVPTALNVEVLMTDALTGQGFSNLAGGNMIDRMIARAAGANATGYIILKRDGKEVRRWPLDLLEADQQGPYFPGFPLNVRGGQIQFYFQQAAGTLGTCQVDVVWQNSLVPVTI